MGEYDLDALRAAARAWLDGEPGTQERAALWSDLGELSAFACTETDLLTDAALGRALRAAAERDGPERRAAVDTALATDSGPTGSRLWHLHNAEFRAGYEATFQAAAAALIAFVEANDER